jgi:hypothetical protein
MNMIITLLRHYTYFFNGCLYCKVLDLRTATPRGEVSMTRLLGSRERSAHPELQLWLRLETPREQPSQELLTQRQVNRWDNICVL